MHYWVQYHNCDKLDWLPGGYEKPAGGLSELDTSELEPSVVSTKKSSILGAYGDVAFFIVGKTIDKEKCYWLWSWCIIEDVFDNTDDDDDGPWLEGEGPGYVLNPPMQLTGNEFEVFKKHVGNFAFGLTDITNDPYLSIILEHATHRAKFTEAEQLRKTSPVLAEELTEEKFYEGSIHEVLVNSYERNGKAKRLCLEHHGRICKACAFDFGKRYGPEADGIIHVHHLKPMSEIEEEYEVDPITDLIPVCPNCHAVIHSRKPAYSIHEVQTMIQQNSAM